MQDIKELNLPELERAFKDWGEAPFRARQVFSWIYKKGVKSFGQMSNLPLDLRNKLKNKFYIYGFKATKKLCSLDQTEKFLFGLRGGNFIEGVVIPAKDRITGCISTQAGCKFACRFCSSGLSGFKRNLTTGEILEEVLCLKNYSLHKKLTHLVFMGTGEPLDNYDNVLKAIRIINADYSFNIGARRITISTCGIIPAIKRLADEGIQIELSISLHAADDNTRSMLLPVNKTYPLKDLIISLREYIKKTGRQVTFEYILIKGVNSDLQHAERLIRTLKGLNCKINLIPANPVKEFKVEPPDKPEITLFRNRLFKSGMNVTLRKPRGQDIGAACGQLRLSYEEK